MPSPQLTPQVISPIVIDVGPAVIDQPVAPAPTIDPLAPPEQTDWKLVAITGVALAASVAMFLSVLRTPPRRPQRKAYR